MTASKLDLNPKNNKMVVKKEVKSSFQVGFLHIFAIFSIFVFAYVLTNGNPTQKFGKLVDMARRGMAGGEKVDAFDKVYSNTVGNSQHSAYDGDVANSFYNLATDFYEYGWGDSFHFGFRQRWEPHSACIDNSQAFVAQKLNVKNMDRVLDVGCGIGGPLRGVVRRTGANVTGVTINQHQVDRAYEITSKLTPWMQERCHFVKDDYLEMKNIPSETFDAAFYMESSLHCENRTKTFEKTFRSLKSGGRLVAMEYVTLPDWNPENKDHAELMRLHLHGNGAARTPSIDEDLEMIRAAGFQIIEHYDFMTWGDKVYGHDNTWQWWADLQFNYWPDLLPAHPWIRRVLPYLLDVFASIGLVPSEVPSAAKLMNMGGDGLSGLGKLNAITPQYYVLAIKP